MRRVPNLSKSITATIGATTVAAHTSLDPAGDYVFSANTACWVRQGVSRKFTCVAKASMADTDFVTIVARTAPVEFEFDTAGDGVTAGRVQVDISSDTSAANVATRLAAAINANATLIALGVIATAVAADVMVDLPERIATDLTLTENVANAGFLVATGIMQATAGSGSRLIGVGVELDIVGANGPQLGVIQDATGGKSCTTRCSVT